MSDVNNLQIILRSRMPSFLNLYLIFLACIVMIICLVGCGGSIREREFILPEGFRGPFFLIVDPSGLEVGNSRKMTFFVSDEGVAKIRDPESLIGYSVFSVARFINQTRKFESRLITWVPPPEEFMSDHFWLGGPSLTKDDKYLANYFFVNVTEYEEFLVKQFLEAVGNLSQPH